MCIAVPGKVEEVYGDKAVVSLGSIKKEVTITLIEDVKIGEYLLIHAGFAINKIDKKQAIETLNIFEELANSLEGNYYGDKNSWRCNIITKNYKRN